MTGLLITAILFPLAGSLLGRRTVAEAFLLGLGVVGGALFVLGVLHVPFVITLIMVVVAGAAGLTRRSDVPRMRFPIVLTMAAVAPIVMLAVAAAIIPLHDFDGRAFWLLKAKALADERSVDGPFFHGAKVTDPRNQYPLLIPLDAAAVMMAAGESEDRQVRWIYLFAFAAFVLHLRQRLARFVEPAAAAWCAALLAWTPQFAVNNEGGSLSAYSDIALAAFIACAFFELMEPRAPLRFGLWLSFLVLTKNEGLPIAAILLVIGAWSFRRRIIRSIAPFAIAVTALLVWRANIPRTDEENLAVLLPALPSHLDRFIPAVAQSASYFFALSSWGLLWTAGLAALAILALRREWRAPAIVLSVFVLYVAVYMITQWTMRDLIAASANRLLMHMIGPALFAIARVSDSNGRSRYSPPVYRPRAA
jgi:hypothetical protein